MSLTLWFRPLFHLIQARSATIARGAPSFVVVAQSFIHSFRRAFETFPTWLSDDPKVELRIRCYVHILNTLSEEETYIAKSTKLVTTPILPSLSIYRVHEPWLISAARSIFNLTPLDLSSIGHSWCKMLARCCNSSRRLWNVTRLTTRWFQDLDTRLDVATFHQLAHN